MKTAQCATVEYHCQRSSVVPFDKTDDRKSDMKIALPFFVLLTGCTERVPVFIPPPDAAHTDEEDTAVGYYAGDEVSPPRQPTLIPEPDVNEQHPPGRETHALRAHSYEDCRDGDPPCNQRIDSIECDSYTLGEETTCRVTGLFAEEAGTAVRRLWIRCFRQDRAYIDPHNDTTVVVEGSWTCVCGEAEYDVAYAIPDSNGACDDPRTGKSCLADAFDLTDGCIDPYCKLDRWTGYLCDDEGASRACGNVCGGCGGDAAHLFTVGCPLDDCVNARITDSPMGHNPDCVARGEGRTSQWNWDLDCPPLPNQTRVYAAISGTVVRRQNDLDNDQNNRRLGYGNRLCIQNEDLGLTCCHNHLQRGSVIEALEVLRGQEIGLCGNSGYVIGNDGTHLDFYCTDLADNPVALVGPHSWIPREGVLPDPEPEPHCSPEICNGLDDDCDGETDEDIIRPCHTDCGEGTETCSGGSWTVCSVHFRDELCNNRDDNCNGQVDEFTVRECINECGVGQERCTLGVWGACNAPRPSEERCDNLDNDCDGEVDEEVERSCRNRCGEGTQTCHQGEWGECSAQPEVEICDNEDNDCDGITDWITRPCENACGRGEQQCVRSQWHLCSVGPMNEVCNNRDDDCDGETDEGVLNACGNCGQVPREVCDGQDNNCDGVVDDGCPCRPVGAEEVCGIDIGECQSGLRTCNRAGWGACRGAVTERAEICDGLDNDCDGDVDENVLNACNDCGPVPREVCDEADNDCDGIVDEGCQCIEGAVEPCGFSDVGFCQDGTKTCNAQGQWGACHGNIGPRLEVCNNIDDDCNGQTDERLSRACARECGNQGVEACNNGNWGACNAAICPPECIPRVEICDNIDNDCDGVADWFRRPCATACGAGQQLCRSGQWFNCDARQPQQEVCNDFDDDCDGVTDEGCGVCNPGQTRACGSDVGFCQRGIETCGQNRQWGACVGSVNPRAEVCNAIDDDCDGAVDENLTRNCANACGNQGTETCARGVWGACNAVACPPACVPEQELCDGDDNDCDGEIDEGVTNACGECGQVPSEECDGIDNDCDGQVDGHSIACNRPCGNRGTVTCTNGRWSECNADPCPPECVPEQELCDGQDNDCDGAVDENLSRACSNACGNQGTETCARGVWGACNAAACPPVCNANSDWTPTTRAHSSDDGVIRLELRDHANDAGVEARVCKVNGVLLNNLFVHMEDWSGPALGNVVFDGTLRRDGACTVWGTLQNLGNHQNGDALGGTATVVSPNTCGGRWDRLCDHPPNPGCGSCWDFGFGPMTRTCR